MVFGLILCFTWSTLLALICLFRIKKIEDNGLEYLWESSEEVKDEENI